jgi:hypothetical protein
MRLAQNALAFVSIVSMLACGSAAPEPEPAPESPPTRLPEAPAPTPPPAEPPSVVQVTATPVETPKDGEFAEVVYVLMRDTQTRRWFCTGTLVAKTTAVTAAHCLDTTMFVSYEIVAPLAAAKPRVAASKPRAFGGTFEDVANPDIGLLTLEKPIELARYATLTDVTARVEAGEKLTAAAVVRTAEKPEAPLQISATMPLSSTVEFGYEHGFGTPLFTHGGDSGAGLFLVENGAPTHGLIGVARQPEPVRNLDHFTRIDAAFLAWYAENTVAVP